MKRANDCNVCDPCKICDDDILCMCSFDYQKMQFLFDEDIASGKTPLIGKRSNGDYVYQPMEKEEIKDS